MVIASQPIRARLGAEVSRTNTRLTFPGAVRDRAVNAGPGSVIPQPDEAVRPDDRGHHGRPPRAEPRVRGPARCRGSRRAGRTAATSSGRPNGSVRPLHDVHGDAGCRRLRQLRRAGLVAASRAGASGKDRATTADAPDLGGRAAGDARPGAAPADDEAVPARGRAVERRRGPAARRRRGRVGAARRGAPATRQGWSTSTTGPPAGDGGVPGGEDVEGPPQAARRRGRARACPSRVAAAGSVVVVSRPGPSGVSTETARVTRAPIDLAGHRVDDPDELLARAAGSSSCGPLTGCCSRRRRRGRP